MTIRNRSNDPDIAHLAGAMSEGTSGYITGMEAQGQRELLASAQLPAQFLHSTRADFEALGFTFGEPSPDDPLFRPATLPEGWKMRDSDHDMWSYIDDEHGVERAAIFYKAAWYDRKAHISLTPTST